MRQTSSNYSLAVLGMACLWVNSAWAIDSGSTGADGAFNPTVSAEIQLPPSGIFNYTSINIPAGVTIKYKKNTLNTPVFLLASGNVTIAGTIDVSGSNSKDSGTYGDGNLADDGIPGVGGPGGYDGGRGGRDDTTLRPEIIRGGAGLGPGGGLGGIEGGDSCRNGRYFQDIGMGGGYATNGSIRYFVNYCGNGVNAAAKPYGSVALQPLIGGSGGGGGRGGANYSGVGGGGGGGAILVAASGTLTLSATGKVLAGGGSAGGSTGTGGGSPGAGGTGGAIRLIATTITGSGALNADGGCITENGNSRSRCGVVPDGDSFGGSVGRIRLETTNITYSGASVPAYSGDTPSPVFVSAVPTLRIASIGGSTVPAEPTGNADLTFPANLSNPVVVNLETINIPPGNTVEVKVVPAYGTPITALSPAITGSNAAGTTSVSVTLPQGPSTLQAVTSYTVTVAMGENLSRFAQNERVQKVEIIANVGPTPAIARLITVSGKRFDVPTAILQIAGFNG